MAALIRASLALGWRTLQPDGLHACVLDLLMMHLHVVAAT